MTSKKLRAGPPRIRVARANGTDVEVAATFTLNADLSRLRPDIDHRTSPPRIRTVLDDGTEVKVSVEFGLDADLTGLCPDDDKRKPDGRTPLIKHQL